MNEINNNLQRVRELTVQSSNGSNSKSDLDSIQSEIGQRMAEIDRTSAQTDFNGTKVLGAAVGTLKIQVGAGDGETIDIGLKTINTTTLGVASFNINGTGTANTASGKNDLILAGGANTPAADVNGTAKYTVTANNTLATKAQLFAAVKDADSVVTAASTYTYSATKSAFTFDETGRSKGNTIASLTPPAGSTNTATVAINGKSTDVKIDNNGTLTTANGGAALYLDSAGNLTQTGAGTVNAATLTNLTESISHVASGTPSTTGTGGTITTGSTVFAAGATPGTFDVTGDRISAAALSTKLAAGSGTAVTASTIAGLSGVTLDATGVVTSANAYAGSDGSLGSTSTTKTDYFLHSNGSVMDNAGNAVYNDSANAGKFTLTARSGTTSTANAMKVIDAALATVDGLRGALGAVQNRFDSVISNLGSTITNLSASRSRIEDADYATEVSNLTRAQILQQAGTSVLAKANQSSQGVLSLLQ